MLELLQYKPGITGPELADRLEVDVRTVRRYISKLQDVGIPVEAEPGRYGGYWLRPGFKLPPLVFTEDEATAILIGLLSAPSLGLNQPNDAIAAALSKITRVLPESARARLDGLYSLLVVEDSGESTRPDSRLIIELSHAVHASTAVRIVYTSDRNQTTERVVEPYAVVAVRTRWYLIAYCRLRRDIRTFRTDRIDEYESTDDSFVRDAGFDCRSFVRDHLEKYTGSVPYSVLFHADAATVRERTSDLAATISETEGGALFSSATDSFPYEARYLARLGMPFTIVGPSALADAVLALSRSLAASAGSSVDAR